MGHWQSFQRDRFVFRWRELFRHYLTTKEEYRPASQQPKLGGPGLTGSRKPICGLPVQGFWIALSVAAQDPDRRFSSLRCCSLSNLRTGAVEDHLESPSSNTIACVVDFLYFTGWFHSFVRNCYPNLDANDRRDSHVRHNHEHSWTEPDSVSRLSIL